MCVAVDANNHTIKEKHCICPSNFTGDLCGEPRACEKTCENGGTCMFQDSTWWLGQAESAYYRESFAQMIDDCLHKNDIYGAAENKIKDCINALTGEYCNCTRETFGEFCESTCDPGCGTNGSCQFWNDGPRCQCKCKFFIGDRLSPQSAVQRLCLVWLSSTFKMVTMGRVVKKRVIWIVTTEVAVLLTTRMVTRWKKSTACVWLILQVRPLLYHIQWNNKRRPTRVFSLYTQGHFAMSLERVSSHASMGAFVTLESLGGSLKKRNTLVQL